MARLVEKAATEGLLPRTVGGMTLLAAEPGPAYSLAPFRGQAEAVSEVLGAIGLSMPNPGEALWGPGGARAIWVGPGRALVLGPVPDGLGAIAAVASQTGALAAVAIDGPVASVEALLARLVPLDLRPQAFPRGRTARTLVGHMTASVTRIGAEEFEIIGPRSMAATLVEELREAALGVAARVTI